MPVKVLIDLASLRGIPLGNCIKDKIKTINVTCIEGKNVDQETSGRDLKQSHVLTFQDLGSQTKGFCRDLLIIYRCCTFSITS